MFTCLILNNSIFLLYFAATKDSIGDFSQVTISVFSCSSYSISFPWTHEALQTLHSISHIYHWIKIKRKFVYHKLPFVILYYFTQCQTQIICCGHKIKLLCGWKWLNKRIALSNTAFIVFWRKLVHLRLTFPCLFVSLALHPANNLWKAWRLEVPGPRNSKQFPLV